jgi:hypothetical protein
MAQRVPSLSMSEPLNPVEQDPGRTLDPRVQFLFEAEVLQQWRFAVRAGAILDVEVGKESMDWEAYWFAIDSMLGALANISKVFFPPASQRASQSVMGREQLNLKTLGRRGPRRGDTAVRLLGRRRTGHRPRDRDSGRPRVRRGSQCFHRPDQLGRTQGRRRRPHPSARPRGPHPRAHVPPVGAIASRDSGTRDLRGVVRPRLSADLRPAPPAAAISADPGCCSG